MSAPVTRTLPYVLRAALAKSPMRLTIAEAVSVPSPTTVEIDTGGVRTIVARLTSFQPTPGLPVYLLVGTSLVVAIGDAGGAVAGGEQGPPGPQGPAGPAGPAGPQGPAGAQGPKGDKGDTGAAGAQGPQGNPGAQGAQGPKGDTGAQGAQGPQGPAGAQGAAGTPGSVWWFGVGAPPSGVGVVGDFYLDTNNGAVYTKTGSAIWSLVGNMRGPQGAQGDVGPMGPQGPVGPQGPSGAGTFVAGAGAPTAAVGVDGAMYLDTASGRMWGPKASGAWPAQPIGRLVPLAPTYAQLKAG